MPRSSPCHGNPQELAIPISRKSRCVDHYLVVTLPGVRECTLFSADRRTSQLVATAGAALGLAITYQGDLPQCFPEQGLLLIATDLAPTSIPGRPGVLLLDLEVDVDDSSGALVGMVGGDQEVVTQLAGHLSTLLGGQPPSKLISIVSAAGGLGLTTLVALLGLVLARTDQRTLLIDQSDQLLRIIGAKGMAIDHELQPAQLPRVGVLAADVIVTPALLFDVRARFDSVIVGAGSRGMEMEDPTHSLLLTANTALAVEQGAKLLAQANSKSVQILLRRTSYGALTTHQVSAALRSRIVEWPTDSNLALAADFGDLSKAKGAVQRANQIWLDLVGGRREN